MFQLFNLLNEIYLIDLINSIYFFYHSISYFNGTFSKGGQNQHLKFQLMMTDLGSHMSEHVQDIRYWLAKLIKVHPGQIIMTALQSEPIVVTFMVKKADVKTFLKYIETDDGQIDASRKKVEKVETVINIGKIIRLLIHVIGDKSIKTIVNINFQMILNFVFKFI